LKVHATESSTPFPRRIPGIATFLVPAFVGALILVVGIVGLPRFLRLHTEPTTASTGQMASADSSSSQPTASKAESSSSADVSSPESDSLKVSEPPPKPPASDAVAAENAPVSGALPARDKGAALAILRSTSPSSAATAKPAASTLDRGEVLDQVLPTANPKAMSSIHGTFHVTARVQVDASGKVTDAELEDPGPSKYFANLTEKAARQWEFSSPESDGHSVPSEWLIRFEFSSSGVRAIPTQARP
jgi:TonB family protein